MPRRLLMIPRYRVRATPLALATMYAAAGYGIGQGLGILTSGPARFTSPIFALVRHWPTAWGLTALLFGLCVGWGVFRGHFYIKALGLLGLSAWSLVFATVSFKAYLSSDIAAPTPIPAYYFIAIVLAILVWTETKGTTRASSPLPR